MNYDTTIQSFDETGTIETSVPQEETSVKKNRKHMTPDEQIEYYKQQKEELDKKIKEAKRNLRDKERKERTRNLIRLGGVVVKYVPDATTDSTADLIQIAQAAKSIMPSITPHQIENLLKMYASLFNNPADVRIDKTCLEAIYNQRKYIAGRLVMVTDVTDN